jgi:hypothetical protein
MISAMLSGLATGKKLTSFFAGTATCSWARPSTFRGSVFGVSARHCFWFFFSLSAVLLFTTLELLLE